MAIIFQLSLILLLLKPIPIQLLLHGLIFVTLRYGILFVFISYAIINYSVSELTSPWIGRFLVIIIPLTRVEEFSSLAQ